MKELIFCEIDQDGKMIKGKNRLAQVLKLFRGKRVTIEVEKTRAKRSDQQNKFFHGVIVNMYSERLLELGWKEARSKEWTKDYIKKQVLMIQVTNEETGEVITMPGKTSELTKSEFMDLVADCQQWAAENLDLYIPDPNSQLEFSV